MFIVVIRLGERKYGLIVDNLVGEEELVIKPLDNQVVATELVSGASMLGDGHAIVAITHDMRLVAERANRVIAMSEGRIVFDGAPDGLFGDAALLRNARLRPPPITQVGQRLGLRTPWLRISDAISAVESALEFAS